MMWLGSYFLAFVLSFLQPTLQGYVVIVDSEIVTSTGHSHTVWTGYLYSEIPVVGISEGRRDFRIGDIVKVKKYYYDTTWTATERINANR